MRDNSTVLKVNIVKLLLQVGVIYVTVVNF